MSEAVQLKPTTIIQPREEGWKKSDVIFVVLVLGGYWLLVFNQLRVDWSINPQYYYGWVVPLLALGSFHLRWVSRPAAISPKPGSGFILVVVILLAALLPIRLVEEANPEWRFVFWAHAVQMVALTLSMLYYTGGWPLVKHCVFPVCFLLVAVPWPVPLEHFVIQGLMRNIAAITVETVGMLDIPAVQHGNVIQISNGLVGIDEACSGVRSVQTTLFVSLFLGELYQYSASKRIGLLAASLALALVGNVGRTTFLVWCASHSGLARMHELHDTAGMVALGATLLGLWALAQWLRPRHRIEPAATVQPSSAHGFPRSVLWTMVVWVLLVEATTQVWYRSHEAHAGENSHWSVAWPSEQTQFTEIPIDEITRSILRYTTARNVAWEDTSGNRWQVFFFRWEPGRNSAQLATTHTPDICLQAAGFQLKQDLGPQYVTPQGIKMSFRQSVFTQGDETLHVFYCLWEDRPFTDLKSPEDEGPISLRSRLHAVEAGRRHLGQQVLEVALQGPATQEQALKVFESGIDRLITR